MAPGREPRNRDCITAEGAKSAVGIACQAIACARRSHEPAPRRDERSATTVERCEIPGEPAARKRARPTHPIRKALRSKQVGTSPCPRARGPAPRLQAGARTDGGNALEGRSPGRHRRSGGFGRPTTARTRRGKEALKATARSSVSPGRPGAAGTSGGQGPREGYRPWARGKPWRAKPEDAPALRRREDRWFQAARGVAKPRTRHAAAGGPAVIPSGSAGPACVVGQEKLRRGSTA